MRQSIWHEQAWADIAEVIALDDGALAALTPPSAPAHPARTAAAGQPPTQLLVGGTGNDTLVGGSDDDTLWDNGGTNLLQGLDGNDWLGFAVGANGTQEGGAGNDTLVGADGADRLDGGAGNDFIDGGGAGSDTLLGGDGDDTLFGGEGTDLIEGGAGNDYLDGGAGGNDTLDGGPGADTLVGSVGNTHFYLDDPGDRIFRADGADDTVHVVGDFVNTSILTDVEHIVVAEGVRTLPSFIEGVDSGFRWGAVGDAQVLSFSFASAPANGEVGVQPFDATQQQYVREALDRYSAVADLSFVEAADDPSVDLRFFRDDLTSEGYGGFGGYAWYPDSGDVHINVSYADYSSAAMRTLLLHEIGHALGMRHPYDDPYLWTGHDTVMTYGVAPSELGLYDVATVQYYFGPNPTARTGDDSYDFGDRLVWDGAGTDLFSAAGETAPVGIDLRPGSWLWLGAPTGDIRDPGQASIGHGSWIENAAGGTGADYVRGNDLSNELQGGAGNDTLVGDAGNDLMWGGSGADSMTGGGGDDTYHFDNGADLIVEAPGGGTDFVQAWGSHALAVQVEYLMILAPWAADGWGNALDNRIYAGSGNNRMDGGSGIDTLSYDNATAAVAVSLALTSPQATGGSGTDTISNFEHLWGGAYDDTLAGSNGANFIEGGYGNDAIAGGLGNDTLTGGEGHDTLDGGAGADSLSGGDGNDVYTFDNAGDQIVETPTGGTDEVRTQGSHVLPANLENLVILAVGAADGYGNVLNNTITAGAGNNRIDGGGGIDTLSYASATAAVTVSLALVAVQATGGSGSDTITNFENLTGSAHGDTLGGNAGANVLDGGAGHDSLSGEVGNDTLAGSTGNDTLNGGAGADSMSGGDGNDVYYFDNAADAIVEAPGGGTDEVRALGSHVMAANVENLVLLTVANADAYGNGLDNLMTGGAGHNKLVGGAGNDTLTGAAGNDTVTGGSGADRFTLSSLIGSDTITDFASGSDKLVVSQAGIPVGNGNATIDGATTVAGPGGFATTAELIIVTGNVVGAIDTAKAATAIGSANSAYVIGNRALFMVDNGVASALYLFSALDADAQVEAGELTLLASLTAAPSTTTADLLFGP